MNGRPSLLWLGVALAAAAACGSSATTSTNLTSPSSVRCQAGVTNSSPNFGPSGGTGSITISVSRECSWSAAAQAPWIAITSAREGQGDGTVTYKVDANADPVARQGALVVSEKQVAIAQAPAPCRFEVAGGAPSVPAAGGSMSVEVRTHQACGWSAASEVSWASVSPASAQGGAVARITVAPNASPSARPVSVIVAGQRLTATQAGVTAPPPSPPPPPPPPGTPAPAPPEPPPPAPPDEAIPVSPIKLEGRVQSVSGTCPLITFVLQGRTVYATAATEFKAGPCKDVTPGRLVKVDGMLMSDGRVRASKIELRKDDDDDDDDDGDDGLRR